MDLVVLVGKPKRPAAPTSEFKIVARYDVPVQEFIRQANHPAAIQNTGRRPDVLSSGKRGGIAERRTQAIAGGEAAKNVTFNGKGPTPERCDQRSERFHESPLHIIAPTAAEPSTGRGSSKTP